MSVTRVLAVPGSSFDAGVSHAGPPAEPGETPKHELRDDYLTTISKLFTDGLEEDSPDRQECEHLLARRVQLNEACAAFVEKLRAPMREKLLALHEEAKAAVRAQQEKIDALLAKITQMQMLLNQRKDDAARALSVFHTAQQRRKDLSRYATHAVIAEFDTAVAKAERAVDRANGPVADLQNQINRLVMADRPPLQQELNRLMGEELELGARITGEPYSDALGIQHGPRPPIV